MKHYIYKCAQKLGHSSLGIKIHRFGSCLWRFTKLVLTSNLHLFRWAFHIHSMFCYNLSRACKMDRRGSAGAVRKLVLILRKATDAWIDGSTGKDVRPIKNEHSIKGAVHDKEETCLTHNNSIELLRIPFHHRFYKLLCYIDKLHTCLKQRTPFKAQLHWLVAMNTGFWSA